MKVLFVGDGHRDSKVIPAIVEHTLGLDTGAIANGSTCESWSSVTLHGRGYARRLPYFVNRARTHKMDGVVCTVDSDKAPKRARLKELLSARQEDRTKNAPFPTAIGEARPHLEAWLLDDREAVRAALPLPDGLDVPSLKKASCPKTSLNALFNACGLRDGDSCSERLAMIAESLDPLRCHNAQETGLKAFVASIREEFGPRSR
jgi:hypothetical protein